MGQDCSNTGADGAFAYLESTAARNQRGVSNLDTLDVGDGVIGARRSVKRDPQIPRSGLGLGMGENGAEEQGSEREREESHHKSRFEHRRQYKAWSGDLEFCQRRVKSDGQEMTWRTGSGL